jgi:hypothetical protein
MAHPTLNPNHYSTSGATMKSTTSIYDSFGIISTALFAIIFATVMTPVTTCAQIRWMPDETVLAATGVDVKMGFNNTQVIASIGATRHIIWSRGDSVVVASSQNGDTWSRPVLVAKVSVSANLPTLVALSDGKLCAGWSEANGIKTAFSSDGGKTWGAVQTLATRGGGLCLASGQTIQTGQNISTSVVYALWHSGSDDTPSDMMFATWQNGAWSAVKAIDAAAATNAALWGSLCVAGSTVFAVWRENTTGEFRVYLTRSTNGGTTWETPRNVVMEDRSGDPTVAFSGGQVVVAYQRAQQIYTITSGDATGTIFNAPKLIGPGLFARVIANDRGFVALVWERFTGANSRNDQLKQTGFVYSTDYGFTFSNDSALSATGSKLGLVQFTGANEITASWFNVNNGGTIVAKRATIGGTVSVRGAEQTPFSSYSIAPNPASDLVRVQFTLPKSERVSLKLFNALGQEVAQILDETLSAGEHEQSLMLSRWSLVNGAYFVRLQTSTIFQQQSLQVMR